MENPARTAPPRAVLFDRDGTLVHDVPFNDESALVRPIDGAREAIARLRSIGIAVGVPGSIGPADAPTRPTPSAPRPPHPSRRRSAGTGCPRGPSGVRSRAVAPRQVGSPRPSLDG